MEVVTQTIEYHQAGEKFTLLGIGDIHAGVKSCDEPLLDRVIAEVRADDRCRWFGLGDYGDYVNVHDGRFDISNLAPWLLTALASPPLSAKAKKEAGFTIAGLQRDWIEKKLTPIAGQCMGLVMGNHEDVIRRHFETETTWHLASRMNVPNLGYDCYLRLNFDLPSAGKSHVESLIIYIHHGYFAGRLAGGLALNLERLLLANSQADIVWVGHAHRRMAFGVDTWDIRWKSNKPLQHRTRYAILSGPFKRAYSLPGELPTWEEMRGFPASTLGPIRVVYTPGVREVKVIQ